MEPEVIEGRDHVAGMVFRRTRLEGLPFEQRALATNERVAIDCGLVLTSIGYRGHPLPARRSTSSEASSQAIVAGLSTPES